MSPQARITDRVAPWILLGVAASLRLWHLDVRPLHHDEGTNVIFLMRLLREGRYQYDPTNYHGPLFYFLGVVPLYLFGCTTTALRLVPAVLGSWMAALPWMMRRELGRAGAFSAGLLLAVSPSLVYYARDAIHETIFVFLSLVLVIGMVRGLATGRGGLFLLAGAAGGGILATKETAGLTFLALLTGLLVSRGAGMRRPRASEWLRFGAAVCVVAIGLYSDFFSDWSALAGPLQAIRFWGARGLHADGHGKPWWYFASILARDETALLAAAIAGAAVALWRRRRFPLFLAGWSAAIGLFYSCIPYKTPWLVLNVVLPLALLGGTAFAALCEAPPAEAGVEAGVKRRVWGVVALALATLGSARHAYGLSFVSYDKGGASQLVYVQTRREVAGLLKEIEDYALGRPEGRDVPIEILSPDYLPLNWYLRDFGAVSYYGSVVEHPMAPVVIARSDACDRVADLLGGEYRRSDHPLRPGVDLCLFLKQPDATDAPHADPGLGL